MSHNFQPKIAVLLAAYNGMQWIGEQIETIFNQQRVEITLFISVDLSTDGTYEWAEQLASKHGNVELLPYGEHFGGAGPNFFRLIREVDFAGFDAVSFADQDDIWMPEKLAKAYAKIEAGQCDGYSSNVTAFWADGKEQLVKKDYLQTDFDYIFESAGPGCTFVITQKLATAIKKSLISKKNEVKRIWLHDWYCYAFSRSRGFKWFIDSVPTMAYRQHGSNQVGANSGWKSLKPRVVSILSGDGILKALNQAKFLGLNNLGPVSLLCSGKRVGFFKLALLAQRCRRKPLDKFMFFIIFCWFAIRGLPIDKS